MKIGLAVSTEDALPSAYVVYRDDLCRCIERCADLGYDGVELALRHALQVEVPRIKQRLAATGLEIPCISTGQVFAADHLYFTHPDASVRDSAVGRIIDIIRLASEFNAMVNLVEFGARFTPKTIWAQPAIATSIASLVVWRSLSLSLWSYLLSR